SSLTLQALSGAQLNGMTSAQWSGLAHSQLNGLQADSFQISAKITGMST
ncbi:MAG: hypothetical protein HQM06_11265, partial [Magnetococcales bacterium]|nr:hypothetical protein [Magnetococcales bacterium]